MSSNETILYVNDNGDLNGVNMSGWWLFLLFLLVILVLIGIIVAFVVMSGKGSNQKKECKGKND